MHTYCSLGSPHLGYIYTDNTFVDGGLWFLKKIKNSASLHQFALTDSKNPLTVLPSLSSFSSQALLRRY